MVHERSMQIKIFLVTTPTTTDTMTVSTWNTLTATTAKIIVTVGCKCSAYSCCSSNSFCRLFAKGGKEQRPRKEITTGHRKRRTGEKVTKDNNNKKKKKEKEV